MQVQNWVGNAVTTDAAQQILGQGGVPNAVLTKGGKDFAFRLEHAILEEFWNDRNTCRYTDADGTIKNPGGPECAQGISAVKAIALAQSQGQKIYTINVENRDTALPKLSLSGEAGAEIRAAIMAGKEVTFHERAINAHGWTGVGYIIVDPDTGAGAYLIEGKGNGGLLILAGAVITLLEGYIGMATVIGMAVSAAVHILGLAFILAGFATLVGDSGLCKDILLAASAAFLGALAGILTAVALEWGWAIKLIDGVIADMLIGFGVSVGVSQFDRAHPLFRICGG